MERCPCCTARLGGAAQCPRCQADLSKAVSAEKSAQLWLAKAIQYWEENQVEQCLSALELSLRLQKTELAVHFRDFVIQQNCRIVLDLLAQNQLLPAIQQLYRSRRLLAHSRLLQQLQSYTVYLLARIKDTPEYPSSSN